MRPVAPPAAGCILLLLAAHPPLLLAQTPDSVRVASEPSPLVRGTLGRLHVRGVSAAPPTGEAAGEPLHFTIGEGGEAEALIAVPFEDVDSIRVTLLQTDGAGVTETLYVTLPVLRGDYRTEQLRVPAKYAEPDSAAAERIRSEIELAKSVSRQAHETPRAWTRPFRLPRPGRVTSVFGTAREFNGAVLSRQMGTDFAGAVGAPVYAANTGVVALTGDFYLAGRVVYLDHGAGLVTGYFHLSRIEVEPGALVQRGQRIGRVGRSGRVTGPHLHWIARYGAVTVDPMSLIRVTSGE